MPYKVPPPKPSPYFSQLGRRGMKFFQVGELQESLAGCCCVAIRFSLRESFFLERAVSGAHLALRVTEVKKKLLGVVLFQYFTGKAHSFSWTCRNSAT